MIMPLKINQKTKDIENSSKELSVTKLLTSLNNTCSIALNWKKNKNKNYDKMNSFSFLTKNTKRIIKIIDVKIINIIK